MAARKAAAAPPDDPDKLQRQAAGEYRSADGRFTVRNDGGRWFLLDGEQSDELGQPLVRGPYGTLDGARGQLQAARQVRLKPLTTGSVSRGGAKKSATSGEASALPSVAKPKPKPLTKPKRASWIDRLPAADAARVRALVRALEREGIADAEMVVRRDREGIAPAIVQRLIERQLAELVANVPVKERAAAERLVRRAAAIVAGSGAPRVAGLPGWQVVEIGPEPIPKSRRVTLPD
jgi:hypothetical protein